MTWPRRRVQVVYPSLSSWAEIWPNQSGDISFPGLSSTSSSGDSGRLKLPQEWLRGFHGFWEGWTAQSSLGQSSIDRHEFHRRTAPAERTPHHVVRHLLAAMSPGESSRRRSCWGIGRGIIPEGSRRKCGNRPGRSIPPDTRRGSRLNSDKCRVFAETLTSAFRFLKFPARTVYAVNATIDRRSGRRRRFGG